MMKIQYTNTNSKNKLQANTEDFSLLDIILALRLWPIVFENVLRTSTSERYKNKIILHEESKLE